MRRAGWRQPERPYSKTVDKYGGSVTSPICTGGLQLRSLPDGSRTPEQAG